MEGRYPLAIRLVESGCSDPDQEESLNAWWFRTHLPEVLKEQVATHGLRYENADPGGDGDRYLVIWEFMTDDLVSVNARFTQVLDRLQAEQRMHPAVRVSRRTNWRRIGPEFKSPQAGRTSTGGLFIIESNCSDPEREGEFNRWYDRVHIPDLLSSECFLTAYRFEAEPGQAGGRYLAIYETDGDPMEAVDRFVKEHRPRLKAAGRLSDIIDVTRRGIFRRL